MTNALPDVNTGGAQSPPLTPVTPVQPSAPVIWPVEVLAMHLVAADANVRFLALNMAIRPGAPVDGCVDQLVSAADLNATDALALPLVAVALGGITPGRGLVKVHECLAGLAGASHPMPVRMFAAHGLFRHKCMPDSAAQSVASMLLVDDANARKIALLAISPFAARFAAQIAGAVASVTPDKWTSEALGALGKSAENEAAAKKTVEAYVMRSLAGQAIVPTGIAGYVALAQLNSGGPALVALTRIATDSADRLQSSAAIKALVQLGETARPAAKDLAKMLVASDDPEREEELCQALLQIRTDAREIPLQRVIARIGDAPDRSAAAHCMLLCLHPKVFANTAVLVKQRFETASNTLKSVLARTYQTLTGLDLVEADVAKGA